LEYTLPPESALAHHYLDNLKGLEIGGSAHNVFGLNTQNVDFTKEFTVFKELEIDYCGRYLPVDIESPGDDIAVASRSQDFVVSSHVLEHFVDPIKALLEWYRVIKHGGFIFMIVPHRDRTFDSMRCRTTLQELLDRHAGFITLEPSVHIHYSVWITEDVVQLINHMNAKKIFPTPMTIMEVQDVDDKVGNGFTIVLKK